MWCCVVLRGVVWARHGATTSARNARDVVWYTECLYEALRMTQVNYKICGMVRTWFVRGVVVFVYSTLAAARVRV